MTYRNRIKKTRSANTEIHIDWLLPDYKVAYFKKYYRDCINPHTGKYIGWVDSGWNNTQLIKAHRRYSKKLIEQELIMMEEIEEDDRDYELEQEEYVYLLYLAELAEEEERIRQEQEERDLQEQEDLAEAQDINDYSEGIYDPYYDY